MALSRWLLPPSLALVTLVVSADPGPQPIVQRATLADPAPACPLTTAQEAAALVAFESMMPVVRHPRCNNCHGGVNPLVPYAQGGHMGGFIDTTKIANSSVQTIREVCNECHVQLPGWDTPGPPMLWAGKTTKQICMQFKRLSHDPADFIGHITNEHGGTQFIEAAFKGERALDESSKDIPGDEYNKPFKVEPPPGSHAALIQHGTAWANAVGLKGWTATPECGCELHKDAWIGTATALMRMEGEQYSVEETAQATVYFELDRAMSRGVPQEYWNSRAGQVEWQVKFSGRCTGEYSGTTPIVSTGLPMAQVQIDPERNNRYTVSIAPWDEKYYPVKKVPCNDAPPLEPTLPRFVAEFWRHDPAGGTVTGKGTLIDGSYQLKATASEQQWSWSFRKITATAK